MNLTIALRHECIILLHYISIRYLWAPICWQSFLFVYFVHQGVILAFLQCTVVSNKFVFLSFPTIYWFYITIIHICIINNRVHRTRLFSRSFYPKMFSLNQPKVIFDHGFNFVSWTNCCIVVYHTYIVSMSYQII